VCIQKKDVDLLLVDSGDLHDGTGLSDGFPPGGVDAHDSNEFVRQLPYDIMAIGKYVNPAHFLYFRSPFKHIKSFSHELYIYNNTLDMFKNFVPKLHGRYLSSNVNITVPDSHGKLVSVPVGERFRKFKTRKYVFPFVQNTPGCIILTHTTRGRKVTSLGVLFDFTGNDNNTTVQKVEDMVNEQWFHEAIQEEPDFFLLVG
jgi:hypothetical protein